MCVRVCVCARVCVSDCVCVRVSFCVQMRAHARQARAVRVCSRSRTWRVLRRRPFAADARPRVAADTRSRAYDGTHAGEQRSAAVPACLDVHAPERVRACVRSRARTTPAAQGAARARVAARCARRRQHERKRWGRLRDCGRAS